MKLNAIKLMMAATGVLSGCAMNDAAGQIPEVLRSDNVYFTATAQAPDAVVTKNGDIIVAFTNHGDVLPGTEALLIRSTDGGKTWSEPYQTHGHDDLAETGVGVAGLTQLHNGDILAYRLYVVTPGGSLGPTRRGTADVLRSTDGGQTFEVVQRLNSPPEKLAAPYGPMTVLKDGTILLAGFIEQHGNGFWESKDNGQTWSDFRNVWNEQPKGVKQKLWFNETAYEVLQDGSVYAIARNDVNDIFYSIVSTDNGKTWSEPKPTNIIGGSPALHLLKSGALMLVHRDAGRVGLSVSLSVDGGNNWVYQYALPASEGVPPLPTPRWERPAVDQPWQPGEGHVGYPAIVELPDGNIYIVWHLHNANVPLSKPGKDNYGLTGNLLSNPTEPVDATGPQVFPSSYSGAMLRAQVISGPGAASALIDPTAELGLSVAPIRLENQRTRDAQVNGDADAVYYVLDGEASFFLGAGADAKDPRKLTEYKVAAGDVIVVPAGSAYRISNPDGFVELMVFNRLQ